MRAFQLYSTSLLFALAVAGFSGCGGSGGGGATVEAEREHFHEGLHGGQIVELGGEEYHAELVHDDATHKVGVYLLDGTAKAAAPIDAPSVTINCIVSNQPAQFTLVAMPQPGDPTGGASYFELMSEQLCDGFDAPGAKARLNILIAGKPYVGEIKALDHGHAHN